MYYIHEGAYYLNNVGFSMIKVSNRVEVPKYGGTVVSMIVVQGTLCIPPMVGCDAFVASPATCDELGRCMLIAFRVVDSKFKPIVDFVMITLYGA